MGLNLGGILAGVSQSVVKRIEEEEDRLERIADEERSYAMRQRAAKDAERRKKQAVTDEVTSSLSMYFNEDQVKQIMSKGLGAAQTTLSLAGDAVTNGYDPVPLLNFPTPAGGEDVPTLSETEQANFVKEVTSTPRDSGLPEITTGELGKATPVVAQPMGGMFNLEYIKKINAPADEEQASLDSAYAIAAQKAIKATDPDEKKKYETLRDSYLEAIKAKDLALENEGKGEESSPFSKQSMTTIIKEARINRYNEAEFDVDINTGIAQKIGGRKIEFNVAEIAAMGDVMTLTTRDGKPMSAELSNLARARTTEAIKKIQLAARQGARGPEAGPNQMQGATSTLTDRRVNMPEEAFQRLDINQEGQQQDLLLKNANQGQYRVGDIVFVKENVNGQPVTRIKVYTGIPISNTHNMFIDAGIYG